MQKVFGICILTQESSKREEWYEHKMRLLKQDKRRRGETIGKLLRCLDDMKDQGKLDETKVTEGRLLLAATINSRGRSMENRIYAAVEAMETERGATITSGTGFTSSRLSQPIFLFSTFSIHQSFTLDPGNHDLSSQFDTRAHHGDEIPERDVTYHLTCLLIYH